MRKLPPNTGFTLIELLVVVSILGVIGMAVYGTFANGINVWKRITQRSQAEDINLFFEKITFDLRNSFKLTGLRFKGGRSDVAFPVRSRLVTKDGLSDTIGQATYFFDRRKGTVNKSDATYSEVFYNKDGTTRVIAQDIKNLRFEYYFFDAQTKEYAWVNSWQEKEETLGLEIEENLPLIVKIELTVEDDGRDRKYVRTIPIPSACCWPEEKEDNVLN